MPLLLSWDFAAAVPSVLHQWLFFALSLIAAPTGLQKVVFAMYYNVGTYVNSPDGYVFIFTVLSG
eukprot:8979547-Lingulodinium_polyedra.AAC.1